VPSPAIVESPVPHTVRASVMTPRYRDEMCAIAQMSG